MTDENLELKLKLIMFIKKSSKKKEGKGELDYLLDRMMKNFPE